MRAKILGLVLLASLPGLSQAEDIYRWTDEQGQVNYGNTVPERFRKVARKIDTSGASVTVAPRRAAEKAAVENAPAGAAAGSSTGSSRPANSAPASAGN